MGYTIRPNEDPFTQFGEMLYEKTWQIARRYIYDEESRKEVVHYTIARVLPHWARLYVWSEAQLYGYLRKAVIRNHWRVSELASRLVFPQGEAAAVLENVPDDDLTEWVGVDADFSKALEVLTPYSRTVYILRILERWPYERIAAYLETSALAVRQAFFKADKKVRRFLKEQEYLLEQV